jgi:hypothetical protein
MPARAVRIAITLILAATAVGATVMLHPSRDTRSRGPAVIDADAPTAPVAASKPTHIVPLTDRPPVPSPSSDATALEREGERIGQLVDAQMSNVKRLRPTDFEDLDPRVRQELDRRGCTIPQVPIGTRHNVIRGRFLSSSVQWAVLCSRDLVSSILVLDLAGTVVADLNAAQDRIFMQGNGDDTFFYSRQISTATPDGMRSALEAYGDPQQQKLRFDHDGIEDAFIEKASGVWYWTNGKWVTFIGSD